MLYHGSKSGIKGAIAPISRAQCDFGKGFYMGTDRMQPLTLICNYPEAKLYTCCLSLSGLTILDMEIGIEWALFIAFNRGKMELARGSALYQHIKNLADGCDLVIGCIANDRMFVVLDRFFQGDITDVALIHSLSALQLGKQYVARTEKACHQIELLDERPLTEKVRQQLKEKSERSRAGGIAMANDICKKYRREGRFFDEIINIL